MKKITKNDIENILDFEISIESESLINEYHLEYRDLSEEERDNVILKIVNHLFENLIKSGKHRLDSWEKGWFENLELLKSGKNPKDLLPKYFGKHGINRWNNKFVYSENENFDYKILTIFVDAILHKFVSLDFSNLYEFGCGPAYHLLRFGKYNQDINLIGCDWTKSSQDIINEIKNLKINEKLQGFNFNFFEPNYDLKIKPNSAVFTCSALEQVGENYELFVEYLLINKPRLCINFEPMTEFLNENNLFDKLSIEYSKKRNYLSNFFNYLLKLEKEDKIEIIYYKRLYCGNLYLESFPVVIWKPK